VIGIAELFFLSGSLRSRSAMDGNDPVFFSFPPLFASHLQTGHLLLFSAWAGRIVGYYDVLLFFFSFPSFLSPRSIIISTLCRVSFFFFLAGTLVPAVRNGVVSRFFFFALFFHRHDHMDRFLVTLFFSFFPFSRRILLQGVRLFSFHYCPP